LGKENPSFLSIQLTTGVESYRCGAGGFPFYSNRVGQDE